MKKYQPPEEYYEHCGSCVFCFGLGCFFCIHPTIKDLPATERRLMCFDKSQPALEQWKGTPIPSWCPLDDVDIKVIIRQRVKNASTSS